MQRAMQRESCPVCRILLDPGMTHCPKCGLRVAALPRKRDEHATFAEGVPYALLRGLVYGAGLVAVSVLFGVIAAARGGRFSMTLDNSATVLGGLSLCAAFLMGGVRTGVLSRGLSPEERLAKSGRVGTRDTRLTVAVAGGLCVLVAIVLLPLT